jgi:hypothetical protein
MVLTDHGRKTDDVLVPMAVAVAVVVVVVVAVAVSMSVMWKGRAGVL